MTRTPVFYRTIALAVLIPSFVAFMFWGAEVLRAEADPVAAQQEIQTFFNGIAVAFDQKDVEGIAKSAVPDAVLQSLDGSKMTIEQWKATAAKEFPEVDNLHTLFVVETAKVTETQASVTYTETHRYEMLDNPGHRCESLSRWKADLIKTPEGWRIKTFELVDEQTFRDGEPVMDGTLPKTL